LLAFESAVLCLAQLVAAHLLALSLHLAPLETTRLLRALRMHLLMLFSRHRKALHLHVLAATAMALGALGLEARTATPVATSAGGHLEVRTAAAVAAAMTATAAMRNCLGLAATLMGSAAAMAATRLRCRRRRNRQSGDARSEE